MTAVKYIIFAIISTLFNLLFQYFSFALYGGFASLYIAMFFGTLAGLIVKYVLDKKFIFYHYGKGSRERIVVTKLHSYPLGVIFYWVIL